MFAAGVLGNAVALVLLEVRRRRRRARSARGAAPAAGPGRLFPVLLTALLVTDLLGTCSVSPLVMAAYARNESLRALGGSEVACQHFGFAMTFLSLVTLALMLCMALERCLSVSAPYFYARRLNARCGYVALALVYASGALFCLAPFFRFGEYVQYCPGTWCFVDMQTSHVYKNLYASCMLLMIACTVLCNACVIYQLVQMYRRCTVHRGSARRLRDPARTRTLSEELEHLVLLVFMTISFLICSLPLVICVYISCGKTLDLTALLMLSWNPILHPWVFLLLSPPVPRLFWGAVCKMLRPRPLDNKLPMSPRLPTQPSSELQT
ncbi:prostaglandin E receptor 2b subtype EP2 [Clarias gariepinus]